uniref:Uncharacterized protein n=1 Tax=Fibrocapsa japonica TaxID=94617 RepID=A0A7S2V069_9STRA
MRELMHESCLVLVADDWPTSIKILEYALGADNGSNAFHSPKTPLKPIASMNFRTSTEDLHKFMHFLPSMEDIYSHARDLFLDQVQSLDYQQPIVRLAPLD